MAVPHVIVEEQISISSKDSNEPCDLYDGTWVPDEGYPLYNASHCPFAETSFNCLANGRKDNGYLKWRWRPNNCEISRFDVGDSMGVDDLFAYRSVFLVQIGSVPRHSPKRVRSTVKLDELDNVSSKWIDSGVLVFNTDHWWNRAKLFEMQGK
ncbi:putative PMR5 domain, PC-Esterase [Helianthus annuus]|nr:putative PMR5 domain, PC-Esterase [Helianthus annuus]